MTLPSVQFLIQNGLQELVGIKPFQAIGGIIPYAVISTNHDDQLSITQKPIEIGAAITDHAFKQPATLVMRVAWFPGIQQRLAITESALITKLRPRSASFPLNSGQYINFKVFPFQASALLGEGRLYLNSIYDYLLFLQNSRLPFDVYTTRRAYKNILISELNVNTVMETQNSLVIDINMQEIILATTQTTTLAPTSRQANAASTSSALNKGNQNLQPLTLANTTVVTGSIQQQVGGGF